MVSRRVDILTPYWKGAFLSFEQKIDDEKDIKCEY
jgi:hypothetical protein